uniref:Uncharacterized protein n=1 Tax=viral metagenome TaxID=1070528 RepID=A0A6C0CQ47_9ZZZZ
MSSDCSSQIKKTIQSASSNTYNMCDPPPPFMSVEVCKMVMGMKNKMQAEANANAEASQLNSINGKIMNIMNQVGCDDACQKRIRIDELRKKWKDAEKAQAEAPSVTEEAEKKYYVLKDGLNGWHDVLMNRYTNIADDKKTVAIKKHGELIKEIHTLIDDYKGETIALSKMRELLKIRIDENDALKNAIDSETATTQTNDRRVIYSTWAGEWLLTVRSLLKIIYIVLAIVYLVWGPFLSKQEYKTMKGWIAPIVLIIMPFTIYYIVKFFYFINEKIAWWRDNKGPKDVFLDLKE